MVTWYDIRRQTRKYAAPLACVCAISYFAYHTVQGHRSLITYVHLDHRITEAQSELATIQAERNRVEKRVALLRPEHLDRDLLDEQARKILGLGRPDELVVFNP
jgi:cell division protein FtsB